MSCNGMTVPTGRPPPDGAGGHDMTTYICGGAGGGGGAAAVQLFGRVPMTPGPKKKVFAGAVISIRRVAGDVGLTERAPTADVITKSHSNWLPTATAVLPVLPQDCWVCRAAAA